MRSVRVARGRTRAPVERPRGFVSVERVVVARTKDGLQLPLTRGAALGLDVRDGSAVQLVTETGVGTFIVPAGTRYTPDLVTLERARILTRLQRQLARARPARRR